ncbi:putative protein BIG GRAIN 1 [Helianthus annuus]|uniref:Protein BIG GRAIN 1-like B n=1 Tax=Helianthus annuus TaxID=4232 RepID=A0A251U294_HELAN|nr:protein BIG GRAIN 1-like B [Helianthus annuus]KAF5793424.1 putative protein BIG GRAIN 1 [Helianthus annuus]KAJ0528263.1 putative protein BIG GRAIN 1 [Helianthus annuus]KAJ0537182.1 putative protein BIG GRAIN 1 [Helianthus annuus]KAJ0544692.1 putative protein BIG GRAIN 1 [Helianthus annuus]KAJ0709695.1 putative protein BIG GRAIN 1 [Helianthus annuus]
MDSYTYRSRKQKPSFSSTLLDVIYQSVDDEHTKTTRNRQTIEGSKNIRDAVFLATGFETGSRYYSEFSSSEADRIYGFPTRLKPLRTSINEDGELNTNTSICQKQLHEPKAKSKAMKKIYRYIKKGTHPVSPGGRLARFLTSLFSTTTNTKKKSKSGDDEIVHADRKSKLTVDVSTPCSFSQTCLNQTRSSVTRNARFYPASMNNNNNIIDDDEYSQRRGHKSVNGDRSDSINKEVVNMHVKDKNRHVEERTRNLLKNYQKKVEFVFDSIKNNDDEDDDETSSYASSDLFELDHLSTIGIDPCMQELPLYETTSVDANRAIANGLSPLV